MYFAIDSYTESFQEALYQSMQAVQNQVTTMYFYALIDGAFELVRNILDENPVWKQNAISLYDNTPYAEIGKSSPQLVLLASSKVPSVEQIQALLNSTDGIPMLSFIASPLNTGQLAAAFLPFTKISTGDTSFLLRYADTRGLFLLDHVLRNENLAGWRSHIAAWWLPTRAGKLASLPNFLQQNHAHINTLTAHVTEASFNQLVDGAETDNIISNIAEQNQSLVEHIQPSLLYEQIQQLKSVLITHKITNFIDQVFFCTIGLTSKPDFYQHPIFNQLLSQSLWQAGKLSDAMLAIEDRHWEEINQQ
jgi:hypothetical protein